MDLDCRQTRRLHLVGTIPFPTPYPSSGTISFESGNFKYSAGEPAKAKGLVVVQDHSQCNGTIIRAILQEDIAAIFVPGIRTSDDKFQISRAVAIDDLEEGEWFVDSDVNAATVRERLKLTKDEDIATRESKLKGIVFVGETARIVNIAEMIETASASSCLEWPTPFIARSSGCYGGP